MVYTSDEFHVGKREEGPYADFETFWKQPNQNQQISRPTTTSVSLGTDSDSSSSEESHKNLVQSPCKVPVKSSLLIESSSPAGRPYDWV